MNNYQVILGPVLTEKAVKSQEQYCYQFWVHPKANKNQIREALKELLGQKPVKVRTIVLKGKRKMILSQRRIIQKPKRKKALAFFDHPVDLDRLISKKKR